MGRSVEHPLPPGLATAVEAVWGYDPSPATADRPPVGVRVLPDGHTDLIVRLVAGPGGFRPVAAVVCGPTDGVKLQSLPAGAALVGVRFRLGWAGPVLGVAPAELVGVERGVAECGRRPAGLLDRLWGCVTVREYLTALADGVADLAAGRQRDQSVRRGQWAAGRLGVCGDGPAVAALARRLAVTERTLHRDVVAATGLPPQTFARIRRFRAAVNMLWCDGPSLAAVAVRCGYADQSHLTREVRRHAGLPPAALVAAGRAGELQV